MKLSRGLILISAVWFTACSGDLLEPDLPESITPMFDEICIICDDEDPNEPFSIQQAQVYYMWVPAQAHAKTVATHRAVFTGVARMTREGAGSLHWEVDIGSNNYGWSKEVNKTIDATGPCSVGSGPVSFASDHYAERNLHGNQTDYTSRYTSISMCERDSAEEDRVYSPGGGEITPTFPEADQCMVRVRYWTDTGEIISITVLYCWTS